ncbi:MAG: hypothetical protein IPH13_20020 [Planctomycetes bacterium]|nr:hypothetical protein [Planctomycetota bacterium]
MQHQHVPASRLIRPATHPPVTGVVEFRLYRRAWDDECTIDVNGATYLMSDADALRLWLYRIGWRSEIRTRERLVDLLWNFRVIHCDLRNCTWVIPDLQVVPEDRADPTDVPGPTIVNHDAWTNMGVR